MNTLLWVIQGALTALFLLAGSLKLVRSREELLKQQPWVEDFSQRTVKLIGTAEVLGALGLILPAALGILAWLTPTAAAALATVMLLAMLTHLRRKDSRSSIAGTIVLFVFAAFVAVERFGPHSL